MTPESLADDYSEVIDDSFAILKADVLCDYENLPGDPHPPVMKEGQTCQNNWETYSDTGVVCVKKTWKSDNDVAPCYKAVGIIPNCTPDDILSQVILNPDDNCIRVWNPTHAGYKVICETDRSDLRHVRLFILKQDGGLMAVVSPRDFGQLSAWVKEDDRIWYMTTSVDDESVNEPNPGYVRGTVWPSGFMLEPVPNSNATRVHYTMHADLAGSLPRWIIDWAIPPQMTSFFTLAAQLL